jgi:hypothetical protein
MATTMGADRQRFWREVIDRQRTSGQSIVEFCAKEGLTLASFHAWKRRLRRPRCEAGQKVAQALLPVQVVDAVPSGTGKLEVRWPDGMMLQAQGCEAQTVAAVVAAISAVPARRARKC